VTAGIFRVINLIPRSGSRYVHVTKLTPGSANPYLEVVPPAKIAKLLRTREGSHVFFAELSAMAAAVRGMLRHRSAEVRRAAELVLNPVALKVVRPVTVAGLSTACEEAERIIAGVVAAEVLEGGGAREAVMVTSAAEDDDADDASAEEEEEFFEAHSSDAPPRVAHVPRHFLRLNEPWRGRVRRERVAEAVEAVEAAARELADAIQADLVPLISASEAVRVPKNRRCHLEHDQRNNALFLRFLPAALAKETQKKSADANAQQLVHPTDRFGKEIGDRWTTPRVAQALETYRVAAVGDCAHVECS
jgi:hypothetical protein